MACLKHNRHDSDTMISPYKEVQGVHLFYNSSDLPSSSYPDHYYLRFSLSFELDAFCVSFRPHFLTEVVLCGPLGILTLRPLF